MVIEIAPASRWSTLKMMCVLSTRFMAFCIGIVACIAGASLLITTPFDVPSAQIITYGMGSLLIAFGLVLARVGGMCKRVDLAFDRNTQEWKLARRRGRRTKIERLAPRGSVLTLTGSQAAIKDSLARPMMKLHLDALAQETLMAEKQRLRPVL